VHASKLLRKVCHLLLHELLVLGGCVLPLQRRLGNCKLLTQVR
jgi:hypothetical protein